MAEPVLLRERHGTVALLRYNRPDRLNAISGELIGALQAALGVAGDDPATHALVLTGSGPSGSGHEPDDRHKPDGRE